MPTLRARTTEPCGEGEAGMRRLQHRLGARRLARCMAAALCLGAALPAAAESPAADNGAVLLMYHRFGEDALPSTSVRLEQFEAHLAELTSGAYHVMALPEIVARLAAGAPLPERTVAITIDDAALSVYREAWPRLKAAKLPFPLFDSTEIGSAHV